MEDEHITIDIPRNIWRNAAALCLFSLAIGILLGGIIAIVLMSMDSGPRDTGSMTYTEPPYAEDIP